MTKPKTLDQLRAEKERAETQLAQEKHMLNRILILLQKSTQFISVETIVAKRCQEQ